MSAGTEAPGGTTGNWKRLDQFLASEAQRCDARRRHLEGSGTGDPRHRRFDTASGTWTPDDGNWALALSGGGIRSATFCLGVLQSLAAPGKAAVAGYTPVLTAGASAWPLLAQFDYVSSVSGGGFTGGFAQGLYAPRNIGGTRNAPLPSEVYKQLAEEPPGRVHGGAVPTPLAWLRENGRYLAPTGTGDMAYVAGFGLRNWLGVHFLFGVVIMLAAAVLALLATAVGAIPGPVPFNWWSAVPIVFALWMLPVAGAYWMTRDSGSARSRARNSDRSARVKTGSALVLQRVLITMVVGIVLIVIGEVFGVGASWRLSFLGCGLALLLAAVFACASPVARRDTEHLAWVAVAFTRRFTLGMQCALALAALALVQDLSHWLLSRTLSGPSLAGIGSAAGVIALGYHWFMKLLPALRGPGSSVAGGSSLRRKVRDHLLAPLAIVLALSIAVFWVTIANVLMLGVDARLPKCGAAGAPFCGTPMPIGAVQAAVLTLVCCVFVFVTRDWVSILNMSGYHHFYSARLTRAYLGAANPRRTGPAAAAGDRPPPGTAEPDAEDELRYAQYHENPAAPIHLINATLAQTVDPSEQLVQRDRKGRAFTVLPCLDGAGHAVYVSIDGRLHAATGDGASLSMGDWLAISGAAVSTGMGRQTSTGAALCVTFVNARIGRWWPSGLGQDGAVRRFMPTYAYLVDELFAQFHGTHRRFSYLTDGGHFENTGVYELLRRVRDPATRIRLVVACDCGADPTYDYGDLANLVRVARIDFGLELQVDQDIIGVPALRDVFGTPETMRLPDSARLDNRCALLLNVLHEGTILARIVVIKPRLISCAASDLLGYYRTNDVFPQQPTSDQFFDEEQWESYRKLGLECGRAVWSLGPPLWERVLAF